MEMLHNLMAWTLGLSDSPYGIWGLLGIAFAESSFFPIPPDLLQIALSVSNPKMSFIYAAVALFGSITGACLGYGIGLWGGRPLIQKLLKNETIESIEAMYNKYDVWAIGIAGFTPVPYKVFAVSGGAFKISFWKFVLVSTLSRGARFFLVATGLYFFGEAVEEILLHNINLFGIAILAAIIIGFITLKIIKPKKP